MKKETYTAPDIQLIEIAPVDMIGVSIGSIGSDNDVDYGDIF